MSEVSYTVDADGYGDPTIWKHERPDDPQPAAVLTDHVSQSSHPEAFRAAATLLAPDDAVRELVARTLWRESVTPTAMTWNRYKADFLRHADAVLKTLRDYATGGE